MNVLSEKQKEKQHEFFGQLLCVFFIIFWSHLFLVHGTALWTFWQFISLSSQTIPLNKLTTLLLAGAGPRFQTVRVGHVQQMTVVYLRGFIASQGRQRGIVGQRSAGRGRSVLRQMESGGRSLILTPAQVSLRSCSSIVASTIR